MPVPDPTQILRSPVPPVVIVGTTDPDGSAHAAPFGSCVAVDGRRLRLGCDRDHDTYRNLINNPEVVVSVVASPDVSVTITGQAQVIKETMTVNPDDAIIEIEITDIKDDWMTGVVVKSGIEVEYPGPARDYVERFVAEVTEG